MPRLLDFSDGFTSTSSPSVSTATGTFMQEVPSGTVDGSNAVFTLTHTPSDANSLVFWVDMNQLTLSDYTLVGSTVTITNSGLIPVLGQSVYVYYIYGGGVGGGGGGDITGLTPTVEYVTLNSGQIAAKQVTLGATPYAASKTFLDVITVGPQTYSVDYTVSGAILSWSSLTLDGFLVAGDILRILYFV